jgi:hypothetical protein
LIIRNLYYSDENKDESIYLYFREPCMIRKEIKGRKKLLSEILGANIEPAW